MDNKQLRGRELNAEKMTEKKLKVKVTNKAKNERKKKSSFEPQHILHTLLLILGLESTPIAS